MTAHRSTAKQSSRSTDMRSRWTHATGGPTPRAQLRLDRAELAAPGHCPSRGVLVAVQFGGQPARDVAIDAVLVGERVDTVQALGRQPLWAYVHIAARVELAQHGLTDQAGLRCV